MTSQAEHDVPDDLGERVDSALRAFWRGDSSALEHLLNTEDAGEETGLGELLGGLIREQAGPVVGLPSQSEVGGYKIIREIGRGGMGVVYEAEQQEPRRRVALKVLRGLEANEYHLKLFRREIQALARLRHPGIATIHEAGRTPDGQHFFTMELVAGEPLSAYVRAHEVGLRERLELFLKIAEAVRYAHEHGVIHRDLKPSNIMVDAEGHVRILDFGLARITDVEATVATVTAEGGKLIGTLAYMSPEQAHGGTEGIDARTDVYALGVVLYELLTGQLPYDLRGRGSIGVSPAEAIRVIREQPPRKPSSTLGWDGRPARHLRGDLETIVLKTLEKEAARRYPSVAEFTADVQRFLRAEPIRARPASGLYFLRKKLSKHRGRVVLVVSALAVGVAGLWGGIWWPRHTAEQQRARTLVEARRAALSIQCALEAGAAGHTLERAREIFDECPELPEACLVWVQARVRVARETGNDALADTAIGTLRQQLARDPSQWYFGALLADILRVRNDPQAAELQAKADRDAPDTADAWYLRSLTTLDSQRAAAFADKALQRQPAHDLACLAWRRLAYLYLQTRDFEGALRAARSLAGLEADRTEWMVFEAHVLTRLGRYREAIARCTAAIALDPTSIEAYRRRGVAYLCLKDYASALADYSKSVDLVSAPHDPWGRYGRAMPLWIMGRTDEAAADYRAFRSRLRPGSYADARLFLVLCDQARQLRRQGSEAHAAETLETARQALKAGRGAATRGSWLEKIFQCLALESTPPALVEAAGSEEERCEAYYYAGEACLLQNEPAEARGWFQKCFETGMVFDPDTWPPEPMNEYHLAVWRLDHLDDGSAASRPPESEPSAAADEGAVFADAHRGPACRRGRDRPLTYVRGSDWVRTQREMHRAGRWPALCCPGPISGHFRPTAGGP
jgi:tetratricopeptide (TPR) repeat protein/predicted Ser/Thr protein kinase